MKKPKSREGVSIDKNAEQSSDQPDWNAMHSDVKRPSAAKDWSKRADTTKPLKKAPVPRRDVDRSR